MTMITNYADRKGRWFLTYTGKPFWPLDPRPEDICLEDIAHHLSMQCRYNGATRAFYSVAQHSCLVMDLVRELVSETPSRISLASHRELCRCALMHDAAEAYIGDMISPLKHTVSMAAFREVEANLNKVIADRFGLSDSTDIEVLKRADLISLLIERKALLPENPPGLCWKVDEIGFQVPSSMADFELIARGPSEAKNLFMAKAGLLGIGEA